MIRWGFCWKLLKQLFSILLISCSILLVNCSVNAVDIHKVWTTTTFNNMEVWVISKWSFITQRLWQWKPIFAFISQASSETNYQYIYLFRKDWLPYFYNSYTCVWNCSQWNKFIQGFITKYEVCNEIQEGDNAVSNCSWTTVWNWTVSALRSFLWTVNSSDYYLFDLVNYTYWYASAKVCISSHSLQQSVCFYEEALRPNSDIMDLTWSIWIPPKTDFQNLLSYYYDNSSPAIWWGWNWWDYSNVWWTTVNYNWWNIGLTCSNKTAINYYESKGFTNRLCYWWLSDFSTTTWVVPFAWQWLWVYEVYSWTKYLTIYWDSISTAKSYESRFNYWRYFYKQYQAWDSPQWISPFLNTPTVLLTYFAFVQTYWSSFSNSDILDYCNLKLYTPSLNLPYSWDNKDKICSSLWNWNWVSNISWDSVLVWNDLFWDSDNSWNVNVYNWNTFIDSFLNTVKTEWNIPTKSDFWLGYLPQYILTFMCLLILFRFLQH